MKKKIKPEHYKFIVSARCNGKSQMLIENIDNLYRDKNVIYVGRRKKHEN